MTAIRTHVPAVAGTPRGIIPTASIRVVQTGEVVTLVAHGLSNDEIAAHMVISPTTAKTHVSRAMTKLRARDRAQLVIYAYESGLIAPRNADRRM